MGHRRPRLSVFGTVGVVVALLLVVALWSSQRSGATTVRGTDATLAESGPVGVEGAVRADGAPESPPEGWSVERPETGRYLVTVPAGVDGLDVVSWDPVADVSVKPLTETVAELRFVRDAEPIDARFTFSALPPG